MTITLLTRGVLIAATVCCTFSIAGESATLIQYGASPGLYDASQGLAVGWQQTSSASGVTISATLGAYGVTTSPSTVTAYVTTALGPGTTTADLIGTANVLVPPVLGSPSSYTLFSGLTLLPGTYYLTLSDPNQIGWLTSTTASQFEEPGFTYEGALSVNFTIGSVNAYTPSSDFYPHHRLRVASVLRFAL